MHRVVLPALLAMTLTGCLTPITDRLDHLNSQIATSQQQLTAVNGQLVEANQRIAHLESQLTEASQRLVNVDNQLGKTNTKLDEANAKLANVERYTKTVEEGVKRVTGVRPPGP